MTFYNFYAEIYLLYSRISYRIIFNKILIVEDSLFEFTLSKKVFTAFAGIAKDMFSYPSKIIPSVFIPITFPFSSNNGPPEFPLFITLL